MSNARELAEVAGSYGTGGFTGMKNRIINGAMAVHQRGGTISASGTGNTYGIDRFATRTTSGSAAVSMQQSSVAPSGFINSLLVTVTTPDTSTSNLTVLHQKVEGLNSADFAWGTLSAQTVTLSFWVRSSVTGTFSAGIQNNASDRSYPATYTISAANTWEYKTVTIPGSTSGTWLTDNSTGLYVFWSLGGGGSGTANTWNNADARGSSGQTVFVGTNGATFYITGVQLEKGSTATSFDYRPYGTELALCQRYLPVIKAEGAGQSITYSMGIAWATTHMYMPFLFIVPPRVAPTGLTVVGGAPIMSDGVNSVTSTSATFGGGGLNSCFVDFTAASGLTQYRSYYIYTGSATTFLFTGCEL